MAGRGRPIARDPRSVHLAVRLTESEGELVRAAAERAGQTVSDWCRSRLLAAAKRQR